LHIPNGEEYSMARQGLDRDRIVNGAVTLVNARGAEALTMAELAAQFHVRTPSLYNHVNGLEGLRRDLTVRALLELEASVASASAGRAHREALHAVAEAYRSWAIANPGLYPFVVRHSAGADTSMEAAWSRLTASLLAALRGYNLPQELAEQAAHMVAATLHGFVSIEISGGFGGAEEASRSFAGSMTLLDSALQGVQAGRQRK
jgi:AcrR family transcriptional regulator